MNFLKLYRMDVYCVREKRFTPNVPGSEKITTTENGRRLVKVKCESCGIIKTRFIRGGKTRGGVNPTPQRGGGYDMRLYAGKRATDPIWSLDVFNIERSFIKPKQPILYYLADGPKRGFVREELLVVPPNSTLPPTNVN